MPAPYLLPHPSDLRDDEPPLWLRCGPRGDEWVRWEDLSAAEQLAAIAHHKKIYGIEGEAT